MTFVVLDLHKRYITACALDGTGGAVGEVRRMPVSLDVLGDFLAALRGPVTVAMEATLDWQWLHDQLKTLGHVVRVADARQVKLIWQTRSKTNPIDARKVAELVELTSFPRSGFPIRTHAGGGDCCTGEPSSSDNARRSRIGFTAC